MMNTKHDSRQVKHIRTPSNNIDLNEVNVCLNQISDQGSEPQIRATLDRNNFAVISASSNEILRDCNLSEVE